MTLLARLRRYGSLAALVLAAASSGSCVEPYQGSWLEFVLAEATHVPGDEGQPGQPPSGTHYEFWVSTGGLQYKVAEFQVVLQIDRAFPCFIEDGDSLYPGLHSTRFYDKVLDDALSDGSATEPEGEDELGRLADAAIRMQRQAAVALEVKAVVGYDRTVTASELSALSMQVAEADIADISDEANARRRTICDTFFAAHPHYFVGDDEVYSVPKNGDWYGVVSGNDPRNNGPLGGAGFTVPVSFEDFDAFRMNWQFNDPADPRIAAYGPSTYGYHYMAGTPEHRTRRVVNVTLQNTLFSTIKGEIAIIANIENDGVQF